MAVYLDQAHIKKEAQILRSSHDDLFTIETVNKELCQDIFPPCEELPLIRGDQHQQCESFYNSRSQDQAQFKKTIEQFKQ